MMHCTDLQYVSLISKFIKFTSQMEWLYLLKIRSEKEIICAR